MLTNILDSLTTTSGHDLKLYLITRHLKDDVKAHHKVLDKYKFQAHEININEEIVNELQDVLVSKLNYAIQQQYEVLEYEVISDDDMKVFTYQMENNSMSFADVVTNQLRDSSQIPHVTDLKDLSQNIWAYCIERRYIANSEPNYMYAFRKLSSAKITGRDTDVTRGFTRAKRKILSQFNTNTARLEIAQFETIQLDRDIDCLYYDENFFVFNKRSFESITGIEEEFKEKAEQFVETLAGSALVEGIDVIRNIISQNPSFHKRITNLIKKSEDYSALSEERIARMQAVIRDFNEDVNLLRDGRINVTNEVDLRLLIKLMEDYFLKSPQTDKKYGAVAKKRLD